MRLYVYCLAEGVERLNKTPPGVSGAPVRIVEFDEDLSALVSVCRSEDFQVNRKNALAHHEVVRSITEQTTPLPTRFGTIVTIEQLRNYVSTHHEAIKAKLDQLGVMVVGSTPEELGAHLKTEMEKWAPVIKAANIKVNE